LLLLGHGLAGTLLAPVIVETALAQGLQEEDDDPGYDLDMPEAPLVATRSLTSLPNPPPRFVVNPEFLPPVAIKEL
jgi:hypothetical protein